MKKSNLLFVVWGFIVIILIALLTLMGVLLKKHNKPYKELEAKMIQVVKEQDYDLSAAEKNDIKIKQEELLQLDDIKELKVNDDVCEGYVVISYEKNYNYKAYLKCHRYTTEGY